MDMINMMNDYNHTAHPRVLEALLNVAGRRFVGYGLDDETAAAAEMVRSLTGLPDAAVHFMPGGTITNLTAVSAFLRPHEAVVAPASGHLYVHETGAIEATGHKVLTIPPKDGKVNGTDVRAIVRAHTDEHMVRPKLLYLSQASELGTVYTRAELEDLRRACDDSGLYLYIDGARLGCALMSGANDMALTELARLADAFYIGGTKNGLLFGEALVINNPSLSSEFRHIVKQKGGLLSKGFLLGIQFQAILEDGLYFELARAANDAAVRLSEGLCEKGVPLLTDTVTNQVFPVVCGEALRRLEKRVLFEAWASEREDGTPIRFVASWLTTEDEIRAVLELV